MLFPKSHGRDCTDKGIGPSDACASTSRVSENLRRQWIDDGFVTVPSVFSSEDIAEYNDIVAQVRRDVENGRDEFGYGDRIGQLHQRHPSLIKLAANRRVVDFLQWAFDDEPVLFGSLNFERGTQQQVHIDAIFFYPDPLYSMAGVWIALEDIHPEAGPLFYLSGSHRWGFHHSDKIVRDREDLKQARASVQRNELSPEERGQTLSSLSSAWTEDLLALEQAKGVARAPMPIKAGDVVIWHSLLAHGGSPRQDSSLSRKSVVFHYIGKHTKLYTHEQFFMWSRDELQHQVAQPMSLGEQHGVKYMRYPYFVTYHEGREIVHPLEV